MIADPQNIFLMKSLSADRLSLEFGAGKLSSTFILIAGVQLTSLPSNFSPMIPKKALVAPSLSPCVLSTRLSLFLASTHAYKNFGPPVFPCHFLITISASARLFRDCLDYLFVCLFIQFSMSCSITFQHNSERVRTQMVRLCSLLDQYSWENMDFLNAFSYGFGKNHQGSSAKMALEIKLTLTVDTTFNKVSNKSVPVKNETKGEILNGVMLVSIKRFLLLIAMLK